MSTEQIRVIAALHSLDAMLKEGEVEYLQRTWKEEGVCAVITTILGGEGADFLDDRQAIEYWRRTRSELFSGWEHFSGNAHYPIPSTLEGTACPEVQFHRGPIWEGEQLEYRRKLVVYLLERYQNNRILPGVAIEPLVTNHQGHRIIVSTPSSERSIYG